MKKILTHLDSRGNAHMVDVGGKRETHRLARASGSIHMRAATLRLIHDGASVKGDVLGVARIAAIQAAKRTSELIPLCHPLALTKISVDFKSNKKASRLTVEVSVETRGKTGVEMEALTAVSIGLLTIYDMCKAVDRAMTIETVSLMEKSGGESGNFLRT
jgi:cyclic pyranopterin phosphate synthase